MCTMHKTNIDHLNTGQMCSIHRLQHDRCKYAPDTQSVHQQFGNAREKKKQRAANPYTLI